MKLLIACGLVWSLEDRTRTTHLKQFDSDLDLENTLLDINKAKGKNRFDAKDEI